MQPGTWSQDIIELNLSFLRLLREAMAEDMALAAQEFGFTGREDKLSMLGALSEDKLLNLASADLLFGIRPEDEERFDIELDKAVRSGPVESYGSLLMDERGRALRPWQQERRMFDLMAWMVIRQCVQSNPLVAKAVFRLNDPLVISRIRRLTPKGAHRLARWGGNSKLRVSQALILHLTMAFNDIEGNLLLIPAGAMQTSCRHVDSNVMV
ncbi:flagellar transcriptional regulator FlhD (plasmid) [Xanthomonas sontii]|uniref:DUF2857 domain-containing protein n=1 Tax=Xanthomonas sacchari TaxID=56458 RepID=A0ABT3DUY0_9XANT|nr:flagellar transcriptional regulator FlhD [Xanthomonas sacchari]MCW0399297.1 hypothetical protein [Xanthomonas sacchari]